MDQIYSRPLVRHLTDDEEVSFSNKWGGRETFRVRVWRGKDATTVVLASPCTDRFGNTSRPSRMTNKIANYALSAIAGYPNCGILYFAHNPPCSPGSEPLLFQIHFEFFGLKTRLRLFRPMTQERNWQFLEGILESKIDR